MKRLPEQTPVSDYLLELGQEGTDDVSLCGGKAVGLCRLLRASLPVPRGVVLTVRAFRSFLEAAHADAELTALEATPMGQTDALAQLAGALRGRLLQTELPEGVQKAITFAVQREGEGCLWAVRSSATREDLANASFAGQQDTFLGVKGINAMLTAVRSCFVSLFSDRACAYRMSRGIGPTDASMAVVLQQQVDATAAGVVFTLDPGDRTRVRLVLEAVEGLGDALVSGREEPERWRFTRRGLRLLSQEAPHGKEGPSPRFCLSEELAASVAALALKAEMAANGVPQDVEWALQGETVWLLQSRAITALPSEPTVEDLQVWTNMNTGEVLPDVVTPITWSFLEQTLLSWFLELLSWLGIDPTANPLVKQLGGRLYFNLNTVMGILRSMPLVKNVDIEQVFGGLHARLRELGGDEVLREHYARVHLSWGKILWRVVTFLFWYARQTRTNSERVAKKLAATTDAALAMDLEGLSDEALAQDVLATFRKKPDEVSDLMGYAVVGMSSFSNLSKLLSRWLPDEESPMNMLMAGVGGMASAEAALSLWRLSEEAQSDPSLASVLEHGTWAALRPRLQAMPAARSFLEHFDQYLLEHGHHTRGEIELFNPRWCETPDRVLDMIRAYTASRNKVNPLAVHAEAAAAREAYTRRIRNRLSLPRRLLFDHLLAHAIGGVCYRENVKSDLVRAAMAVRKRLLEAGRRLSRRELLADASDVFFLRMDELEGLFRGMAPSVKARIVARRERYEAERALEPPPVVMGSGFTPSQPAKVSKGQTFFKGLAVSPGVAEGPARVVLRAEEGASVLPGEVLVAPFTDPGWAPLFLTASAIVMDMGGLLSHGSIVARECGIPAVVNVGPATRMIQTGQWLRVDGRRGEVTVLNQEGNGPSTEPAASV